MAVLEGAEELKGTLDVYWRVMARRCWWLLLPFCLIALATMVVTLLLQDFYRSETLILVEQQKVPERYVIPNITGDLQDRLHTITQQILSRTRVRMIIDEFNLYAKDRRGKTLTTEERVALMRRNIEVEAVRENPRELNAFKVAFLAHDPNLAQRVTSRLTSLFIEENLKAREQQSLVTTNFLEAELGEARQELKQQEERLREFKLKYLGELPEQQSGNLQVLAGLQMQLQNTTLVLNRAREHRVYLESLLSQYQSLTGPTGLLPGTEDSGTVSLEKELGQLRVQRASLLARYTPRHPDVLKIEEEIEAKEAHLDDVKKRSTAEGSEAEGAAVASDTEGATTLAQLQSQLKANQAEIDNLLREQKRLQRQIRVYEQRLNLTPVREQQLADVVRDYNLSKQNYEELLKKKLESQLATDLERLQQGEQFRVLDPPSLPVKPYSPNRPRLNLLGLLLGSGVAVGLALFVEIRDRAVYAEKDLVQLVPLSLVVAVPSLLTDSESRQRRWKRLAEWAGGTFLLLIVMAGELYFYWRG